MSERCDGLDAARGIAILLVLYGHCLEWMFNGKIGSIFNETAFEQWRFIYSFHIPVFFAITGVLSERMTAKPFAYTAKLSLKLLVIADLAHLLTVMLGMITGFIDYSNWRSDLRMIFLPMIKADSFQNVVSWFLVSLAISQVILFGLVAAKSRVWSALSALAVVVSLVASSYLHANYFQVRTWAVALSFLLLGRIVGRSVISPPKWMALPALAATAYTAPLNNGCAFSFDRFCDVSLYPTRFAVVLAIGQVGNWLFFYLTALTGVLAVFALSRLMHNRIVLWCGRHSLELLIANGLTFVTGRYGMIDASWNKPSAFIVAIFGLSFMIFQVLITYLCLTLLQSLIRMSAIVATYTFDTACAGGHYLLKDKIGNGVKRS